MGEGAARQRSPAPLRFQVLPLGHGGDARRFARAARATCQVAAVPRRPLTPLAPAIGAHDHEVPPERDMASQCCLTRPQ